MSASGTPLTLMRMSWRGLYRRPVRTVLTALGVAVGVIAIVAFTTIAQGFWIAIDSAIHINDADMMVFQANVAADIFSLLDEEQTRQHLDAYPEIRRAVGTLSHVLPVEDQPFFLTFGMSAPDIEFMMGAPLEGRNVSADDEVMLGRMAQQVLDKQVGEQIRVQGELYKVVGVYEADVVFINAAIVMHLPRVQALTGKTGQVTAFQLYLQDDVDEEKLAERIEADHSNLVAIADASQYHKVDKGLEIMSAMVWVVCSIALVVGAIVVANTMWMAVLERTREIGVLRAVGWPRRRIVGMILLESAGVGLIGCAVGSLLGVGLAQLTTIAQTTRQFFQPQISPPPFLIALAVAVVLSVLGALAPAWRAAQVSPAEALRYE